MVVDAEIQRSTGLVHDETAVRAQDEGVPLADPSDQLAVVPLDHVELFQKGLRASVGADRNDRVLIADLDGTPGRDGDLLARVKVESGADPLFVAGNVNGLGGRVRTVVACCQRRYHGGERDNHDCGGGECDPPFPPAPACYRSLDRGLFLDRALYVGWRRELVLLFDGGW